MTEKRPPERMRTMTYGNVVSLPSEDALRDKIKLQQARESAEPNPEFDQFIAEVDWSTLDLILAEIARKSGVKPEEMNTLGPERVLCKTAFYRGDEGMQVVGDYVFDDNIINLNYRYVEQVAQELGVDPKFLALQILINGKVNAAKRNALTIFNSQSAAVQEELPENQQKAVRALESGYRTSVLEISGTMEKPQQNKTDLNVLLNDAVIRKLGLEIFREYLLRTGKMDKDQMNRYLESYFSNRHFTDSGELVHFMEDLLGVVSEKIDMDKEVVWRAFVRGLFEPHAKVLDNPTIKQWFAQAFSPDFLNKISKVGSASELSRLLIEKYEK
ncbi:MAG: hypothetical protein ACD_72C00289G0002 [uncultured bacterium]|nr:MAG: hypothetical protein ACD_72C00289G0002 [uncultured bacterium]